MCSKTQHPPSKPIAVTIKKIVQENYRTVSIVTDAIVEAKPGQFIMVWHPDRAEKPFAVTTTSPLSITVQAVGEFSKFLTKKLKPGDKLWYRGPFGNGVYQLVKGNKVLLAVGCGCIPLYALALLIKKQEGPEDTLVVLAAKNKKELIFQKKFQKLGFKVELATEDGSSGFFGNGVELLQQHLINNTVSCVYSCGPSPMLKALASTCEQEKIPIQLSLEGIMKCGFGVCGSCAKNGKLVCQDGPVFNQWLE